MMGEGMRGSHCLSPLAPLCKPQKKKYTEKPPAICTGYAQGYHFEMKHQNYNSLFLLLLVFLLNFALIISFHGREQNYSN